MPPPPARTITVSLDMSIHTLIRQAATDKTFQAQSLSSLQTTSRDAKPTYRNHTSKQRQFKTGVLQGGCPFTHTI